MRSLKIILAIALAVLLLAATAGTALAAGPVDNTPPTEIQLEQNLQTVLQTSRQHSSGPAPCLIPVSQGEMPSTIDLSGSIK